MTTDRIVVCDCVVDGIDEQVVVDAAIPDDVDDTVERQRKEEVDVNANSTLSAEFAI